MRAEHDGAAAWDVFQLVDEHGSLGAQLIDDEFVVDDFVTNIDRCAELLERTLDDGDGAVDPGAEATRIGKQDFAHAVPPCLDGCRRKLSSISIAAPTLIALSATLNAGNGSISDAPGRPVGRKR